MNMDDPGPESIAAPTPAGGSMPNANGPRGVEHGAVFRRLVGAVLAAFVFIQVTQGALAENPAALAIALAVACAAGVAVTLAVGVPYVADASVLFARNELYAGAADVPSLEALHQLWLTDGRPRGAVDDSDPWAIYFVDGQVSEILGGPEAFSAVGEPHQTENRLLWPAIQSPCSAQSVAAFRRYNVGLIYFGRQPVHRVARGYIYNDGHAFLSCGGDTYHVVYDESKSGGPVRIVEVGQAQR